MPIDPQLLALLACPEDKGPLLYFADEDTLYNPRLHRRYRIVDGIPVMLVDEAENVSDDEHERLSSPRRPPRAIRPNFDSGEGAGGVSPA